MYVCMCCSFVWHGRVSIMEIVSMEQREEKNETYSFLSIFIDSLALVRFLFGNCLTCWSRTRYALSLLLLFLHLPQFDLRNACITSSFFDRTWSRYLSASYNNQSHYNLCWPSYADEPIYLSEKRLSHLRDIFVMNRNENRDAFTCKNATTTSQA